jgi:hypothetical protein
MTTEAANRIELGDWESYPDSYFFTVREVADILRFKSRKSVDTAINNGTLKAINVGGQQRAQYRIQKLALKKYIEEQKVKPPSTTCKETSRPANGKLFKHIEPTWLQEPSPPKAGQSGRSSERSSRSSKRSSGPGGRR